MWWCVCVCVDGGGDGGGWVCVCVCVCVCVGGGGGGGGGGGEEGMINSSHPNVHPAGGYRSNLSVARNLGDIVTPVGN